MFNLQGSELIIILLLALVVLGPEKLPEAMRKAGRMYADLKKMASGFQDEFKAALDEPMREMQQTANLLRDSADFTNLAGGERPEKAKSAEMRDASEMSVATDDLAFGPGAEIVEPEGSDVFGALPVPQPAPRPAVDENESEA